MVTGELVESRTVPEVCGGIFFSGPVAGTPGPGSGNWTIHIERYPFPQKGFGVWAVHDPTGAVVPTEADDDGGWKGSKYIVKTLAQARDKAGGLATTLRGTMETYDWRAGA